MSRPTPSQVSKQLVEIASMAEAGHDRRKVVKGLKKVLAAVDPTPSQVFSQAILHGPYSDMDLDMAVSKVQEYGNSMGLDPNLIAKAIEFTKKSGQELMFG